MTPAPLPPGEPELEDLMSLHLDFTRPDSGLREDTLARMHGALRAPAAKAARPRKSSRKPGGKPSGKPLGRGASASSLLLVSVATCGLLFCMGLILFWSRTQGPTPPDEPALWSRAKGLEEEGMAAYNAFVVGGRSGMSLAEQRSHRQRAIEKLVAAIEQMNGVLDPKRDERGILPADYEGYEEDLSRIATYLVDLEKLAPVDPRSNSR